MPSPLTAQQIALYLSKRRAGGRQEAAAAAAGISVSSAHRIDAGRLQPKAAKPRSRRRPDPLAQVWEPLLVPLLERHPALTPTTLLEHLQEQKLDQDWSSVKRTLQRRVRPWKALHGPAPDVMFPLAYQPSEIGFCDFDVPPLAGPLPPGLERLGLRPVDPWRRKLCRLLRRAVERSGHLWWSATGAAHRSALDRQPQPRRQLCPRHHPPLPGSLRPLRPFHQPQQPRRRP